MSGHNPHSHLSQPNSSWNPLQIPSYIPRQPQVAHMSSNERSLVRSPLTWHTPTPPEALYSFISAKHKNLELNPLLPSFVRGPPPAFGGSVDLTVQSNRNNSSSATSPRNLTSPSPDFTTLHSKQISHNVMNNLQNPGVGLGPGVIQTTGSIRDKYASSNGNTCELLSTGSISGSGGGGGGGGGGLYIRDARQINNDLMKMSAAAARDVNEISPLINEQPVELINQTVKLHVVPTSPRRLSPLRTCSLLNHSSISPESTSPALPPMSIGIGMNTDVINNHITSLTMQHQQQQPQQLTSITPSVETVAHFENSPLCSAAQSPLNAASNEDSVDSNASKTRRRRKPNRIIRVPNDSDDSLPAAEKGNSKIYQKDVTDGGGLGGSGNNSGVGSISNNVSDKNENCLKIESDKFHTTLDSTVENINIPNKVENNSSSGAIVERRYHQQRTDMERLGNEKIDNRNNEAGDSSSGGGGGGGCGNRNEWTKSMPVSISSQAANQENENKTKSVIVDNVTANVNRTMNDISHEHHHPHPHHPHHRLQHHQHNHVETHENNIQTKPTNVSCSKFQTKEIENKQREDNNDNNKKEEEISLRNCRTHNITSSKRINSKQKGPGDSGDDIETIDKIAAMIANSNENEEAIMEDTDCVSNSIQKESRNDKNEESEPSSSSKLTDLTEILGTPIANVNSNNNNKITSNTNQLSNQENSENIKEIRFEEVENKLEEMFAGIEDERPCGGVSNVGTSDDQISNDPAVELERPLQIEMKKDSQNNRKDVKSTGIKSTSQKRSSLPSSSSSSLILSSTKQQEAPPKKKRKVPPKKKENPVQKTTKKSTKASTNEKGTKNNVIKDKQQEDCVATTSASYNNNNSDLKYRGPFVQLKPDGSINIVNAPITEDDTEKQNKVKKTLQNHHTNSERSKIRGLHVSTLSTKYDADTIDATWMCVFCKKGPHKNGLGDLFGPYIVTITGEEYQLSQKNPNDDEFVSKRTKTQMIQKSCNIPVVAAASVKQQQQQQQQQQPSTSSCGINTKKKKRGGGGGGGTSSPASHTLNTQKLQQQQQQTNDVGLSSTSLSSTSVAQSTSPLIDTNDIFYGMSKVSDTSYEVWLHEDCAVWASGVYMIGSRIIGLEAAVWSSSRHKCSVCTLNGAMVCCLQRGCTLKAHITCAKYKNWQLFETDFKSYCEKHYFTYDTPSSSASSSSSSSLSSQQISPALSNIMSLISS